MKALTFLASRFVAGETIDEAIEVVRALNSQGIKATLDHLGENSMTAEQAKSAAQENLVMLKRIQESGVDCNVSLKLTQIGLSVDAELAREHLVSIVEEAARMNNFVRIDMEGSAWTQKTLDLFYSLHGRLTNMGIVLQSALRRTEGDCRDAVERGVRVRLCKGAYHEPAAIAYTNREDVNASYDRCAQILARAPRPAFATHDDARIDAAVHACQSQGMQKSGYELQMLYGLRSSRWRELHDQGHDVRIYVPYGTHWLPYFYRRLRERKENVLFLLRNLLR